MDNRKFKQIVAGLYEKMEYRPVGVFLLYDEGQRFLISQSAKDPLVWGPPQGGVEANENIFQNLERELREELGINAQTELEKIIFCYQTAMLDTESGRKNEHGFKKGKFYFFSIAKYVGDKRNFNLQEEELSAFCWVNQEEMISYLRRQRKEKADLLERALDKGIKLI